MLKFLSLFSLTSIEKEKYVTAVFQNYHRLGPYQKRVSKKLTGSCLEHRRLEFRVPGLRKIRDLTILDSTRQWIALVQNEYTEPRLHLFRYTRK